MRADEDVGDDAGEESDAGAGGGAGRSSDAGLRLRNRSIMSAIASERDASSTAGDELQRGEGGGISVIDQAKM